MPFGLLAPGLGLLVLLVRLLGPLAAEVRFAGLLVQPLQLHPPRRQGRAGPLQVGCRRQLQQPQGHRPIGQRLGPLPGGRRPAQISLEGGLEVLPVLVCLLSRLQAGPGGLGPGGRSQLGDESIDGRGLLLQFGQAGAAGGAAIEALGLLADLSPMGLGGGPGAAGLLQGQATGVHHPGNAFHQPIKAGLVGGNGQVFGQVLGQGIGLPFLGRLLAQHRQGPVLLQHGDAG